MNTMAQPSPQGSQIGPEAVPRTLIDLLRQRAIEQPSRVAYSFLANGETEQADLTYAALDARGRAIGALLASSAKPGDRAILLYPSGQDFVSSFFGCLYGGLVAVPAYPLDPARLARTVTRLETILDDCSPAVALTDGASLSVIERLMSDHPLLARIGWISTDAVQDQLAGDWRCPVEDPDSLAVIQYTSGSTRTPRGVMLSHRNVLANAGAFRSTFDFSDETTFVGWVPLAHDLGLFAYVVQPLFAGALSVLMTPEAFIENPSRWMKALARYPRVSTHAPNFAWELAARRISAADLADLDLSRFDNPHLGGEPIRINTLDRFAAVFEPCGFRRERFVAAYGLAEATLIVSSARNPRVLRLDPAELARDRAVEAGREDATARILVSVGRATPDQKIAIVDPATGKECAPRCVGEIWVSGPNVGAGYWNKADETAVTFQAFIEDTREGPFLRTGDLGFLDGGELFVTGRLKDLIILSGRNHYPQDFEYTVERCDRTLRLGCCAAFAVETCAGEGLVVVQEVKDPARPDFADVAAKIRSALFQEHGVTPHAVVLAAAGSVAKTSSGKVRRSVCRVRYLSGEISVIYESRNQPLAADSKIAPRTAAEESLVAIWSQALHLSGSEIGIHDSFFDLGGDSVAATHCLARICEAFRIPAVSPEIFIYSPTVAAMAETLETFSCAPALVEAAGTPLEPGPPAGRPTEIIPIQRIGQGVPLVIVTPVIMTPGLEFASLVRRLGSERPILGIRGADKYSATALNITAIAADYVEALRRFRPRGPYALCGWCFTGVVALEMARRLESEGEQVAFVALFDARDVYFPPMPWYRRLFVRSWRWCQQLGVLTAKVARSGIQPVIQAVTSRHRWLARMARRTLWRQSLGHDDTLSSALETWSASPWPGRVVHIWCEQRPHGRFRDPRFEWGGLTPNAGFFETPGDHYSMLNEPNVDAVVRILASEFARAESAAKGGTRTRCANA